MLKLYEMSIEALEGLLEEVKEELKERRKEGSKEFEFSFDVTLDSRHGKPYVARLTHNGTKLEREFYDLDRSWGKNELTVSGNYTARAGDIIEAREDASRTQDFRYWYLVKENGKQTFVANIDSSTEKALVVKYLKGEISAAELINS